MVFDCLFWINIMKLRVVFWFDFVLVILCFDFQESPFSSFLRNLSPIDDRGPHVPQGFLGLNSPPGVFTSPRINAIREGGSRKR